MDFSALILSAAITGSLSVAAFALFPKLFWSKSKRIAKQATNNNWYIDADLVDTEQKTRAATNPHGETAARETVVRGIYSYSNGGKKYTIQGDYLYPRDIKNGGEAASKVPGKQRVYFKDEAHREPQYGMLEEQVEAQKVNRLVLPCILLFWVILYIGLQ